MKCWRCNDGFDPCYCGRHRTVGPNEAFKEEDLIIEIHRPVSGSGLDVWSAGDVAVRIGHRPSGFYATAVARSSIQAKALALKGLYAMLMDSLS